MVNIVFLILAHTDVAHLERLIMRLKEVGDIIVHIDKKTDREMFENIKEFIKLNKLQNINVYSEISVFWAGFSQVECMNFLLKTALSAKKKYDRFVFLSGLDYPLFTNKKLLKLFENNQNTEFVGGYKLKNLHKVCEYHYFWDCAIKPHQLHTLLKRTSHWVIKLLGFRKPDHLIFPNGEKWDIYFGSQWSGLTRNCAEYVVKLFNDKTLFNYFYTSFAPDELVIPTIVFNSKFRNNAKLQENYYFQNCATLHYLEYTSHIHIYDETDLHKLLASEKPFVRKCVSGKSDKLVELLDLLN